MTHVSGTTIHGRGRLTAAGVAIPVMYLIRIERSASPPLGTITAQLVRLDRPTLNFRELIGRHGDDLVLELEDGRTWGCLLADTDGLFANRTGISMRPETA